jgi:hypothetical protein
MNKKKGLTLAEFITKFISIQEIIFTDYAKTALFLSLSETLNPSLLAFFCKKKTPNQQNCVTNNCFLPC